MLPSLIRGIPLPSESVVPAVVTAAVTRRAPQDVRLPCMVYAAAGAMLDIGTEAVEQAMAETRKAPGVLNVLSYAGGELEGALACHGGVAVIARGYWLARQTLARLMDQCGATVQPTRIGGGQASVDSAAPYLSGLTASSAACTVQFYNGHLRIWISTSDPARVRVAAARIAGCEADAVDLRLLGAEDTPHGLAALVPAISLARQLQSAPVQLIVAYDLGLHAPDGAAGELPRSLREALARDVAVALAA